MPVNPSGKPTVQIFQLNDRPQLALPGPREMKALPAAPVAINPYQLPYSTGFGNHDSTASFVDASAVNPFDLKLGVPLKGLKFRVSHGLGGCDAPVMPDLVFSGDSAQRFPIEFKRFPKAPPSLDQQLGRLDRLKGERLLEAVLLEDLCRRHPELRDRLLQAGAKEPAEFDDFSLSPEACFQILLTACTELFRIPPAQAEDFSATVVGFSSHDDLRGFVGKHPLLAGLQNRVSGKSPLSRLLLAFKILTRFQYAYGRLPEELARDMRAYAAGGEFPGMKEPQDSWVTNPFPGAVRSMIRKGWETVNPMPRKTYVGMTPGEHMMRNVGERLILQALGVSPQGFGAPWMRPLSVPPAVQTLRFDEPLVKFGQLIAKKGIRVFAQQANGRDWPETSVTFVRDTLSDHALWRLGTLVGFRVKPVDGLFIKVILDAEKLTPGQVAEKWEALANAI